MRILLTHDDGVDANGGRVLPNNAAELSSELSDDIGWMSSETDQSCALRILILWVSLLLFKVNQQRFALRGASTNYAIMTVKHMPFQAFDRILSGARVGANFSQRATYSATIAAAMKGVFMVAVGFALLQNVRWKNNDAQMNCEMAQQLASCIAGPLLAMLIPLHVLISFNFFSCQPSAGRAIKIKIQGKARYETAIEEHGDGQSLPYDWTHSKQSSLKRDDVFSIRASGDNNILIPSLQFNLTAYKTVQKRSNFFPETQRLE